MLGGRAPDGEGGIDWLVHSWAERRLDSASTEGRCAVTSSSVSSGPTTISGAVFLSYASQDAEVVKRLAAALREAGIEVWFDQNGLVGGDAWDAKIRKQIAECALFVPVISTATQARLEGYFRIEWKLASQRTHAMAEEKAFLLPVVIDATRDAEAKVPGEFRVVQWTRLPEGEATAAFLARVKQLLGGEGRDASPRRPSTDLDKMPGRLGETSLQRKSTRPWLVPTVLGAAAVIALALWQLWKKPAPTAPIGNGMSARTDPATAAASGPSREATETEKNFARMAAIYARYGDASHEDLVLAEDLGAQLVKREPTNANAWAAYAHATLARVQFDAVNEEYPAALSRAQRAASLEADGFEPRFALASVYALRSVTRDDGLRLLRKLADEKPDDVRVALSLARGLGDGGEHDSALKALARPGAGAEKSPHVWNARSGILMVQMRLDEAIAAIDQSISLNVGPAALMRRGYIQVFLQDDYRAAAETISIIPGSFLIRENETWAYGWFWLNHRNPEKSLARWRAFYGDFVLSAPKGYYVGRALEMSGQLDAAKFEWRAALRLVESKLATEPDNKLLLCWKAMLAACLEEKEKSQQALAVVRTLEVNGTNAYLVPLTLARLGRNDEAIAELSARWEKLGSNAARFARTIILHEALFDPLRDDARFQVFVEKIRNDPRFPIPAKMNPADQSSSAAAKPDE